MCPLLSFVLVSESQGGEDGSGAERHRGHRADGHRQHHGALGAPPLLYHKGNISSLAPCLCRQTTNLQREDMYLNTRIQSLYSFKFKILFVCKLFISIPGIFKQMVSTLRA